MDSAMSTYASPDQNPQKTATTVDPLAWVCYENVARRRGEHDAPDEASRRRYCWPVPSGVAVLHVLPVIGRIERPVYPRALTSLFKVHNLRRERSEEHKSELQ